jgi:hypothetical protein
MSQLRRTLAQRILIFKLHPARKQRPELLQRFTLRAHLGEVGYGSGDVLLKVGPAEVAAAMGGSGKLFGSNRVNDALSSPAIGFGFLQLNTSAIYEPKRTNPPADWYVRSVTERGQGKGPGSREA